MKNDPPTNLRRGYGFNQARAAGAPFVRPRSGYQMDRDIQERFSKKALNALVKDDPSIRKLVQQKIEAMKTGEVLVGGCWFLLGQEHFSAADLYYFVLYDRPDLAPKGYWANRAKYGYPVPPQSN
jgi:hypothetical protein